jgi:hypothetical protein
VIVEESSNPDAITEVGAHNRLPAGLRRVEWRSGVVTTANRDARPA